jgi:hypothetical protein
MHKHMLRDASWRKSSYSNGEGGNCVEVGYDFPGAARWRKSTYSNGDGGNCVVGAGAWTAFVRSVRAVG